MIKKERQELILSLIKSSGYISITEIAKRLSISESTIRRDIVELDKLGQLNRERGGASTSSQNNFSMVDQHLIIRENIEAESKKLIAEKALSLIEYDSTIFIDAGSSTLTLAKALPFGLKITIVTNSLTIARITSSKEITTLLIGGNFKLTTDAIVGVMAERELENFHFKQAFMGANAVNPKYGFMTPDYTEASLKKKAIQQSENVYFLVDKTKFNKHSVVSFSSLEDVYAITNYVDEKGEFSNLKILEVK